MLASDKIDVRELENSVDEVEEPLDPVLVVEEPGRVDEEGEGGLGLGVVVEEIPGVTIQV